jgi:hypothetical protein
VKQSPGNTPLQMMQSLMIATLRMQCGNKINTITRDNAERKMNIGQASDDPDR